MAKTEVEVPEMDIPLSRSVPGYFKRFFRLVINAGKLTIPNFTDVFAEVYGERPVFFLDRKLSFSCLPTATVTYENLAMITSRIAAGLLKLGVRPGDRVGLMTMNRVEVAFSEFAIWKISSPLFESLI